MLKEEKRHKECLSILEQYYGNYEEVITYATEFGQYKTALRICCQYKRSDLKGNYMIFSFYFIRDMEANCAR